MNKKVFFLLGGNELNYGVYYKFHKKGIPVYVIDWNKEPFIKGDKHFRIDVKDTEHVIYALAKEDLLNRVLFSYTSIDKAVGTVAKINQKAGLHVISNDAVQNVLSKKKMTSIWDKNGLLNRYSKAFSTFDEEIVLNNSKFDVIFKPDDSASSRGITTLSKNAKRNELVYAFERAMNESTNKIVIVEECIDGIEYTADMLGDLYGNVSVLGISQKTHTQNAGNNRISVKLHYNCISDKLSESISRAAINCYKALGLSCSLGHMELIVKDDGTISPIEIAARSSGFIASDLVDIVSGKEYLRELYDVQKGTQVKNGFVNQTDKASVFFFYDFPEGMCIKREHNILEYMDTSIKSRFYNRSRIIVGNRFKMIKSDNDRHGYEILEGPKDILTPEYLSECESKFMSSVGMI